MGTVTATTEHDLTLTVAEHYHHVFQGEGPSAGRLCSFVRLGGCNLTCGWRRGKDGLTRLPGTWACDEAFTWHPQFGMRDLLRRTHVAGLLDQLLDAADPLIVITGGEPLLHQDQPGWRRLLDGLLDCGRDLEVETNGTIIPAYGYKRLTYNVSPKLACSGLAREDRIVRAALDWHGNHPASIFKFVVTCPADVGEAARIAAAAGVPPTRVWIMPEGITPGRVLAVARDVAPAVAAHRFNFTLRQQVLIYGEEGEPRDH